MNEPTNERRNERKNESTNEHDSAIFWSMPVGKHATTLRNIYLMIQNNDTSTLKNNTVILYCTFTLNYWNIYTLLSIAILYCTVP